MIALRDIYCTECGRVTGDVRCEVTCERECACSGITVHRDLCNGGTTRFRINDWPEDPKFYRGQTSSTPPTATVAGEDVMHCHTGKKMSDAPRYESDPRAERRDMIRHDIDRDRGTLPLVIDQKPG